MVIPATRLERKSRNAKPMVTPVTLTPANRGDVSTPIVPNAEAPIDPYARSDTPRLVRRMTSCVCVRERGGREEERNSGRERERREGGRKKQIEERERREEGRKTPSDRESD